MGQYVSRMGAGALALQGAVCGKAARTVLTGARGAIPVPTIQVLSSCPCFARFPSKILYKGEMNKQGVRRWRNSFDRRMVTLGMVYTLFTRIREIRSGEEDDLSNY